MRCTFLRARIIEIKHYDFLIPGHIGGHYSKRSYRRVQVKWESNMFDFRIAYIVVLSVRSFLSVAWPTGVQLVFFFCSGVSRLFGAQGSPSSGSLLNL